MAAQGSDLLVVQRGGTLYQITASDLAVLLGGSTSYGAFSVPYIDTRKNPLALWMPPGNATTLPGITGIQALTTQGVVTARTVTVANGLTEIKRLGLVSATPAPSFAAARLGFGIFTLGNTTSRGFFYSTVFGCSDAAVVAGARQFCGVIANPSALTNVEPSTFNNCIGVGNGAADTTLRLYSGGSAAQAPIDLGANFPANSLATVGYRLTVYAPKDPVAAGFKVGWHVERLGTAFSASGLLVGTAGTAVPAASTLLNISDWRTNNASALAVGLDLGDKVLQIL